MGGPRFAHISTLEMLYLKELKPKEAFCDIL